MKCVRKLHGWIIFYLSLHELTHTQTSKAYSSSMHGSETIWKDSLKTLVLGTCLFSKALTLSFCPRPPPHHHHHPHNWSVQQFKPTKTNKTISSYKTMEKEIKGLYFMFNVAVFSFCVFSDNHKIHVPMSIKKNCCSTKL